MSEVQIIIKKYDNTVFKASLPEKEGDDLIQQLIDREEELAAHDYHGRLNKHYWKEQVEK